VRIRVRQNFRELARDGLEHPGLRPGKEHYVIGVSDESYRVVNHHGEPILYPKELFEVLDASVPPGWLFHEYDEGEYHLEPILTERPGFYEDWHGSDGDRPAQRASRRTLRDVLLRAAKISGPEDRRLIEDALSRMPDPDGADEG
jgi:hypothetical protein